MNEPWKPGELVVGIQGGFIEAIALIIETDDIIWRIINGNATRIDS